MIVNIVTMSPLTYKTQEPIIINHFEFCESQTQTKGCSALCFVNSDTKYDRV